MRFFLEYFAVKFILGVSSLLPNTFVYAFCKSIGTLFFKYNSRRTSLTLKNLHFAYPEKSEQEVFALAQQSYESIAITLAEILLLFNDKISIDALVENTEEAVQKLTAYAQQTTHGTIIVTAHFSNWELAAYFLAKHGFPMIAIGRRGNNTLIEDNITTPFRERYGNKNIYKDQAAVGMIKCLKNKGRLGLLMDQKSGGANSIKSDFFGKPADTVNSVAVLKLKYQPMVLPVFAARQANGKYKIIVNEPCEYTASEEKDTTKRIAKMTQRYNDIIETMVRAYPEQWFWMHDRWRLAK